MSSNPNDFEALRKLMALKRHEQPPPGYLNHLPDRIIARIERGEGQLSLWERISGNFALRPTLAYAFGLTVCGALGMSSVYFARLEMAQQETPDTLTPGLLRPTAATASVVTQDDPVTPPIHVASWVNNTNPATEAQPMMSLFDSPHAMPVAFQGR